MIWDHTVFNSFRIDLIFFSFFFFCLFTIYQHVWLLLGRLRSCHFLIIAQQAALILKQTQQGVEEARGTELPAPLPEATGGPSSPGVGVGAYAAGGGSRDEENEEEEKVEEGDEGKEEAGGGERDEEGEEEEEGEEAGG